MNNTIILPMEDKPIIAHSPVISDMFSILWPIPEAREWLLSNFINIYINTTNYEDQFFSRRDFFINCPWLKMNTIEVDQIRATCGSEIKFITESLRLGYYLYAVVKIDYINAYNKFQLQFNSQSRRPGFSHNVTVFGMDEDKRVLHIADHFENGLFSKKTCSFEEMAAALDAFALANPNYYNIIRSFKYRNVQYKFEVEPMIRRLSAHQSSCNLFDSQQKIIPDESFDGGPDNIFGYRTYRSRKEDFIFGLEIYVWLEKKLQTKSETSLLRLFQLLCDHKTLMYERVRMLGDMGILHNQVQLIDMATEIKKQTSILRNLYLIYSLKETDPPHRTIGRMTERLRWLYENENKFLSLLTNSIVT